MDSATSEKDPIEGVTGVEAPPPEPPTRPRQKPISSSSATGSQAVRGVAADSDSLPWTPPSLEELLQKREDVYTFEEETKAWSDAAAIVKTYSDDMIRRWNSEIDTYLVYAGLFSAILTAFNVQSYLLLQPAPPDPVLTALQQISAQLSSFSTNPPFINSTQPAFQRVDTPSPPVPRAAVWLNTLWFSSLILSLSSASVGIMVKQWLNQYSNGISSGTSRKTAQLRQYRLNGLIEWRVRDIVTIIPILLQLALALFLAGLLVLLWMLDYTVAAVASVFIGLLMAFVLSTTLLPLIKAGCCYLSPQTLALYVVFQRTARAFNVLRYQTFLPLWMSVSRIHDTSSGMPKRLLAMIRSVLWTFAGLPCPPEKIQSWRGREQAIVYNRSGLLDADLVVMAYDTTMDPETLSIVDICISRFSPPTVIECVERLRCADERHFGSSPTWAHVSLTTNEAANNIWLNALICLFNEDVNSRDERWRRLVYLLDGYLGLGGILLSVALDKRHLEWALTALSSIALHVDQTDEGRLVANTAFQCVEQMLAWSKLDEKEGLIDHTAIGYVASACDRRLRQPPEGTQWADVCNYPLVVTVLLWCMLRMEASSGTADEDRVRLHIRAEDALRRLSAALRGVAADDTSAENLLGVYWHNVNGLAGVLADNQDSLGMLVSQDLVSSLEYFVARFRDTLDEQGLLDESYRIHLEATEASLKRLKLGVSSPVQREAGNSEVS